MEYILDFYRKENGECPVELFIDSLEMKLQAKVLRAINMLKTCGNTLREPYSKPLKDGIFELRTSFGSDTVRVLYFFFRRQTGCSYEWLCQENTENTAKRDRNSIEI